MLGRCAQPAQSFEGEKAECLAGWWWIESAANPSQAISTLLQGNYQGIGADLARREAWNAPPPRAGAICAPSAVLSDQGSYLGSMQGKIDVIARLR